MQKSLIISQWLFQSIKKIIYKKKQFLDPVKLWKVFQSSLNSFLRLHCLTLQLFKTVLNKAAIKSLFSAFALIDIDWQNNLNFQATASTATFQAYMKENIKISKIQIAKNT